MNQLALGVFCAIVFGAALSNAETACQNQQRNNAGTGPLQWDIKCDAQGNYLPLQCTKQTPKWCACYNTQGLVTQPSRSIKSCECLLPKYAAIDNGLPVCDIPTCERSGKFEKKQCCPSTRQCHCVDPITGQKKTQPTTDRNLRCP